MFTRNSITDGEAPHQNQSDSNLSHSASPFPSLFLSQSLLHGRYWHFTSNLLFYTNFNAESVIRCAEGVEFQLPSSSFSLRYSSSLPVLWKSSFPLQNPMALSSWPSSLSLSSPSLQSPLAVSRPVPPSPGTSHGHRGTALRCFWGVGSLIKPWGQSPKGGSIYCGTVPTWLITQRVKRRHMRLYVLYRSAALPVFACYFWRQRTFFKRWPESRPGKSPFSSELWELKLQLREQRKSAWWTWVVPQGHINSAIQHLDFIMKWDELTSS